MHSVLYVCEERGLLPLTSMEVWNAVQAHVVERSNQEILDMPPPSDVVAIVSRLNPNLTYDDWEWDEIDEVDLP